MKLDCDLNHSAAVSKIWKDYHKKLTGEDDIHYDEHGNLFGFIAKHRPGFQTEILNIMYTAGYKAGAHKKKRVTA